MRAPFTVATWNVLHRVHAENWAELVPERHPDERARIDALTGRILALQGAVALLALQEVSGDLLVSLRAALPADVALHSFCYPRVPRPRTDHLATLTDPTEHLALLVAARHPSRLVDAAAFADDPGKGYLAVDVAGLLAIATHITHGARRRGQLARITDLARRHPGPRLLLGDFNADRDAVAADLGDGHRFALLPPGALPTRPRADGDRTKPQDIDHIILGGPSSPSAAPITAAVHDAAGLSDHNLVLAELPDLSPAPRAPT